MHDISALRERYLQLRQVSKGLNGRMTERLTKEIIEQGATDLGMMRQGRLVLASVDQSNVLFDYCLYNLFRDGRNEVQRFLAEPRRRRVPLSGSCWKPSAGPGIPFSVSPKSFRGSA